MGFLNRTVFAKRLNKTNLFVLAIIAGIISCGLAISPSTFAEEVVDNFGLYTDSDGVRWEWEVVSDSENTDEPQKLNLMFYDKPTDLTTVTVPSYDDMTTVSGVTPISDTYYVRNANQESQDIRFTNPDPARRTANQADVTVLDMTNTSKVQIMGVRPIINPETEVELIFGENMVIGDNFSFTKTVSFRVYDNTSTRISYCTDESGEYVCYLYFGTSSVRTIDNPTDYIPNFYDMPLEDQIAYSFTDYSLFGCVEKPARVTESGFDDTVCYASGIHTSTPITGDEEGAFSGYRLKLSNLDNVKYLGWNAFRNSIFNESSRSVVIRANQTAGNAVFAGTNINNVAFEGNRVFSAMFMDCTDLTFENVDFGNVETIGYEAFKNTSMGDVDFSNTSIKRILGEAFKNTNITNVDLDGVEELGFEAFANNDITELLLPKSIKVLNSARIFAGNDNLTKLTVAYDTQTSGTKEPLHNVIGEYSDSTSNSEDTIAHRIKSLTVLAPYSADETVSETHLSYREYDEIERVSNRSLSLDYSSSADGPNQNIAHDYDERYGNADSYKNVIAPGYFYAFSAIEDLTIGDGYEFIGTQAFYPYMHGLFRDVRAYHFDDFLNYMAIDKKFHVTLPEGLKGIGAGAFTIHSENDFQINLPSSLEYIGVKAFKDCGFMMNDVDLPNLKYIGTQAFNVTGVHDVYLHDSLTYVGYSPFQGAWNLHDVTFDYDVFGVGHIFDGGSDVPSTSVGYNGTTSAAMFGHPIITWDIMRNSNSAAKEYYGLDRIVYAGDNGGKKAVVKLGKIKFTNKNTTQLRDLGGYQSSLFYNVAAEEIDLGDTSWSMLPERAFQGILVDDLKLPKNLEYIGSCAFYAATITNELELPDSIKVINANAFNNAPYVNSANWLGHNGDPSRDYGARITKLPASLEYVGRAAFYGDYNLTADLNSSNLKVVAPASFMRTSIRDIYLPETLTAIFGAAFIFSPTVRNITFDCDFFRALTERTVQYDGEYPFVVGSEEYFDLSRNNFFNAYFAEKVQTEYMDDDMEYIDLWDWLAMYRVGDLVFTEKAVTEPLEGWFSFVLAGKIDISRTNWKTIPAKLFLDVSASEMILPDSLESIGDDAFQLADIEGEMVLPDSIESIGSNAFSNWEFVNKAWNHTPDTFDEIADYDRSIKITKLPESLEEVGVGAFYGDYKLEADLDLPNLRSIKQSAFMRTSLRDISLHDAINEPIDGGAFSNIPTLRNITIDFDFYRYNYEYGSGYAYQRGFFNIFNIAPYGSYPGDGVFWNNEEPTSYGEVVFTEKAVTEPRNDNYSATMMMLSFDKLDLSRTGWKSFRMTYYLHKTRINELLLPAGLETVRVGTLDSAVVGGEFKIPDSVKTIEMSAFDFAKFDSVVLPLGLEECSSAPFWKAEVKEAITIPEGATIIFDNMFNGVTAKTINIPQSIEKIGFAAFFRNDFLDIDVDLPNLKELGASAFMKTSVRDVVLHDKIESIGYGAFEYIPTLRNITLDCDFFGIVKNRASFYGVFSTVERDTNLMQFQDSDSSTFGDIVFTDKNVTNPDVADLAFFHINKVDISNVGWDTLSTAFLYRATVNEPITISKSIKTIENFAFQWSNIQIENTFVEGLETIGDAAFYGAQVSGDLVIPSTVTSIGWSAFNAGDADTHYETVTIKPALNYDSSDSQAVFQLFWNASMDKLVIESPMLPVLAATGDNPVLPHEVQYTVIANGSAEAVTVNPTLRADGEPEFHGMTMREVEIKNLPVITANAFEECANLESVSFANHDSLTEIGKRAFNNDTKLKSFAFGDGLVGKDVALKEYAFNNTAVETVGNHSTDFDLTAANFNAVEPHVFSNMPKLTYVSIPSTFSIDTSLANEELHTNGSTIPSYTFADDPELATVEVSYQLSTIKEDAFANDNKITKLFLWGNTDIEENGTNLTIPEPTNIFAYSDAPAENYANDDSRSTYDGKFYPLDEVLYLTSNKTYVVLEQDEEGNNVDFDKDGLILYALRRDGVILESDDWQTYTKAYPRATAPNIVFEEGKGAAGNLGTDEELMWTVYDAPKPFDTISLANQNYGETNFEFIDMPSSTNPLVAIHYPDGYTAAIRTTTLASMTKEEEEEMLRELEVPNTGALQTIVGVAAPSVSIAAIIVLSGIYFAKKRKN